MTGTHAGRVRGPIDRREAAGRRALRAGRLADAADALARAAGTARQDGDPRYATLRCRQARMLGWNGRFAEALAAVDEIPDAEVLASAALLSLRAEVRGAGGRYADALADWAGLPPDRLEAVLDGRAPWPLGDRSAADTALLEGLAAAAAGPGPGALHLRTAMGGWLLEVGREDEARAAWRGVAEAARAAGAPSLGLQARAFLARHFARTDAERGSAAADLQSARAEALPAGDPLAWVVVTRTLAFLLADTGLDVPATAAAWRVRATLQDLIGDAGTRLGDRIVGSLAGHMGPTRWDVATGRLLEA